MRPPRVDGPRRALDAGLALFIATLFALEALRTFFASVYALNVLTTSLNASVILLLFLLAPLLFLLVPAPSSVRTLLPALGIFFLASRFLLLVPWPLEILAVLSGFSTALFLLFLVPFLATSLRLAGGAGMAASSVALALAADLALRILGATLDPGSTLWALAYLVPLGLLFLLVATRTVHLPESVPERKARGAVLGVGLGLGGFLALVEIVLLYPAFLARWSSQEPGFLSAAILLGFAVGAYLTRSGLGPAPRAARWSGLLQVFLLIFAVDLAFLPTELLPTLAFLAAVAAPVGMERLLAWAAAAHLDLRAVAAAVSLSSAVLLVFLLAFVFTLTYAYVPGGFLWRGNAPAVLFLAAMALALPALAAGGRAPSAVPTRVTHRWTAAVAGILLVLGASGIALAPSAVPVEPSTNVLQVASYNVHQGFGADGKLDVARIADAVRHANPDLLALQESDTVRLTSGGVDLVGYLASTLGYHAAYGPPTREQTYGVAILSRLPIASWSYALLPSSGDQRVLVHAEISVGSSTLHVFGVHLALDAAERDAQVQEVLAAVSAAPNPKILLGDLNACPSGRCPGETGPVDSVYEVLTAALNDAWVASGEDPDDPAGFTYPSLTPFERIDYIFASAGLQVLDAGTLAPPAPVEASDHRAVLAEIRVL